MHQAISNYKAFMKIIGAIILITGIAMLVPLVYALAAGDTKDAQAFIRVAPASILLGLILTLGFKSTNAKFRIRDGYLVVALCWVAASLIGAFPYYYSEFTNDFIDAFLESTSGFTTTGCTAVKDGVLSHSLLLWKALSHWLGAMGILIFVLSILPALGINGQFIAKAEAPGPIFEKMAVRLSDSTKILYITYIVLTLLEFLLLVASPKVDAFDALVNSLGSISTGGLLVHTDGVAHYNSFYVEFVISIFCILSSVNFMLYHYLRSGKISKVFRDTELRLFLSLIGAGIVICTVVLMTVNDAKFTSAFRDSFFQVISMSTTTGYVRSPYTLWPTTCQLVLFTLMLIGGCSASTSGSIKVIRFAVMIKMILRGTYKHVHPRSVVPIRINDSIVPPKVVSGMSEFLLTYLAILLISSIVVSIQGLDFDTTVSTVLAMLSNTGAAFGITLSAGNFAAYSAGLKLYLCLLMYIGRLEIFTILVMFTRHFWNKKR